MPADGHCRTVTQPDGTQIVVRQQGDEFFHWHETDDGYVVEKDQADNWWKHAVPRADRAGFDKLEARVGKVNPRSLGLNKHDLPARHLLRQARVKQAAVPAAARLPAPGPIAPDSQSAPADGPTQSPARIPAEGGGVRNIVILACFNNHWDGVGGTALATKGRSPSEYDSLFNDVGYSDDGAAGSVKDYYNEVSYGKLTIQSIVTDWVHLPGNEADYGANDAWGNDVDLDQMVLDAISAADAAGLDFSQGDSDGDGWVDVLTIVHSGLDESWGSNSVNCIWSHQGSVSEQTKDSVRTARYHTAPAMRFSSTTGITRIGVICHEMGHFFGLPDLYDYSSTFNGAGNWCIMAGGSWGATYSGGFPTAERPVHMSAWCKYSLGFVKPTEVHSLDSVSLALVEDNAAVHMLRDGMSNGEYFLIENRQATGFDADIASAGSPGILIWHVDSQSANNDLGSWDHPLVKLEEADGDDSLGTSFASDIEPGDSWRSTNGLAGGFRDGTGNATSNSMLYQAGYYSRANNTSYHTYNNFSNFSASGATMTYDAQTLCPTLVDQVVGSGDFTVTWPACTNATKYEIQEGSSTTLTSLSDGAEVEDDMYANWYILGDAHRSNGGFQAGSYSYVFQVYDNSTGRWYSNVQQLVQKTPFKVTDATAISFYRQSRIGATVGYLKLQISTDSGLTWSTLGTYNGNATWSQITINNAALVAAAGLDSTCIVRFVYNAERASGSTSWPSYGVAIDDFQISNTEIAGYGGWTTVDNNVVGTSKAITGKSRGQYAYQVRAYANSAWQKYGPPGVTTVNSVSFTSASQSALESVGTLTVTAQLAARSTMDVTVPFTLGGTATEGGGADYTITASPITITAGNLSADITITVNDDAMSEDDETVIVTMGSPTNALQGATTVHTATILNDDISPGVSSVVVQTGRTVDVTFSKAMGAGVSTAGYYTISGAGSGSLTANPDSVVLKGGNTYTLTWDAGEMVNAGDVTITVTSDVKDVVGNGIGAVNSATHTAGGIGTVPTVSSVNRQTPGSILTNASSITWRVTFSEDMASGTVATGDFTLVDVSSSLTGESITGVAEVNGTTFDVTASTGAGNGTLRLDVLGATAAITDVAGNDITADYTSGQTYAIDKTAPTVTNVTSPRPDGSYKAGAVMDVTVTFTEAVTVGGTPRLALATGGAGSALDCSGGSGTTTLTFQYTVLAGHNSVDLDYTATSALALNGGTIKDAAGNNAELTLASPGAVGSLGANKALVIDTTAPTVTITSATANPTNVSPIPVTVTFSEAVSGFVVGDITVGNGAAGDFAGGPSEYTANITPTGQGAVTADVAGGVAQDGAGNANTAATQLSRTYDTAGPTVVSVARHSPPSNSTNAASVTWRVTFNEAVDGGTVQTSDFALVDVGNLLTGESPASVGFVNATTVVVTANCGTGEGTLRLDVLGETATITDPLGNDIVADYTAGETYAVDRTAPTVVSIVRQTPTSTPTNAATVTWRVTFSEAMDSGTVEAGDFTLVDVSSTLSGESITGVTPVNALTYDVTAGTGTGDGTLRLDVLGATAAVTDVAGNDITADYTGGATYVIDKTPATVASVTRQTPLSNPTNADSVTWRVVFSEAVNLSTVQAGDFTLVDVSESLTGESLTGVSQVDDLTFDVTAAPGSGEGTLRLDVSGASAAVTDIAGNDITADHAGDETFAIDRAPPTVLSVNRRGPASSPTNTAEVTWRITFSEAVDAGTVEAGDFTLVDVGGTISAESITGLVQVDASTYDVTASTGTGDGTLRLDVLGATASINDTIGNDLTSDYTADGETYVLDRTAPTVSSVVRLDPASSPTNADSVTWCVTFSEAVEPGTVAAADFTLVDESGTLSDESVADAVQVDASNYDVTALTGTGDGTLRLDVLGGTAAITDVAGNDIVADYGAGQSYALDRTAPVVLDMEPADGATQVALDAELELVFSENMAKGVGTISIRRSSGDGWVESIDVTDAAVTVAGASVVVVPAALLAGHTEFYVQISATALVDLAGNKYAGIATTTAWNFTTANSNPIITEGGSVNVEMDEDSVPTTFGLTLNATDAENDTRTWSVGTPAGHGTAMTDGTGASKAIAYTPSANWNGSDSFAVQVDDGQGGTDTITVNVVVNARNDAPANSVAPSVSGTHHFGQVLTAAPGTWNDTTDTSVSGTSTLTCAYQWRRADSAGGANAADIDGATASTYTLTGTDNGTYVCVAVTATDDGVGEPASQSTSLATVWTLVANAVPVISQGDDVGVTMDEDSAPTAWSAPTVLATDSDSDTLAWSVASPAGHGTATVGGTGASPATFGYTPDADWNGDDAFVAQVSDGLGGTDTITVRVTVRPRNDPPTNTAVPTWSGTHLLTATTGTWNDNADRAPGALAYAYQWRRADSAGGANAADIADATAASYAAQAADVGKFVGVRVTASDDGEGLPLSQSASATSGWTLIGNVAPVIGQGSVSRIMDEDGSPTAWSVPTVSATDTDDDTLTWSRLSGPGHGTATVEGEGAEPTTFIYTPDANWNGIDSFVVQVSDGLGGTDTITVNVTVNPRPDPPVLAESDPQAVTMDEDSSPTAFSVVLHVVDPDVGDTLTWSVTVPAAHGATTAVGTGASKSVGYTPAADWSGSDSFVVQVSDALGATDSLTVNVTVRAQNDPPVNTQAPGVTGAHRLYGALNAVPGVWYDAKDGNAAPGLTYQWRRATDDQGSDALDIPGATESTYNLVADDAGRYVRVVETATDVGTPGVASAAVATAWVYVEEVLFTFTVSNSAVSELYFGNRTAATDEVDEGLDVVVPEPTAGAMGYACFVNAAATGPGDRCLTSDFRSSADAMTRWRLVVAVPVGGRGTCELGWTLQTVQPGRAMYLQRLEDEQPVGAPVDMATTSSVTVTADSVFEVAYAVPEETKLNLAAGWNLTGTPLMSLSSIAAVLSDGQGGSIKLGPVWVLDGDRERVASGTETLGAERGYWVYAPAPADSRPVRGLPADGRVLLHTGWNLISPVRDTLLPYAAEFLCPAWRWDATQHVYVAVWPGEWLWAGDAYWLNLKNGPVYLSTGD
ncbi:MAG: hypothetical protein A3K19_26470 [Lentisphaerae bacterium RIFOXYB12_FULL_65_16]|nr:MAG: hypothetical protein A3K18_08640 [Lentisphaerae bacterium RIFOXYA12_64_32]OGV87819.1 MAG: hypothetical protein A3K19_26470 [Lentisphaerae bacterium RIFOXYB12_FULL_65_16]